LKLENLPWGKAARRSVDGLADITRVVTEAGLEVPTLREVKRVLYLKSAGIGHPTKSKIEIGVSGKDGYLEDIKVWNAAPAK